MLNLPIKTYKKNCKQTLTFSEIIKENTKISRKPWCKSINSGKDRNPNGFIGITSEIIEHNIKDI